MGIRFNSGSGLCYPDEYSTPGITQKMADYPVNLIEFGDRFRTETECRAYLENIRWPDGFRCPQCPNQPAWPTGRSGLWECASCHQTTVTAGTILEGTRKPLRLWFLAMWLIVSEKNGISAKGLQRQLGFTRYETVWIWLHNWMKVGYDKLR